MFLTPTLTVHPWQRVLERRDGRPTVVLEPGRHPRRRRASYETIDLRERLDLVSPQEVLTADGVTVKISAVLRWAVAEPVAFSEATTAPLGAVYLAVQLALRESLSGIEADVLVRGGRGELAGAALEAARAAGSAVGVAVRDVVVKDVILPSDLRAAYAELVTGRHRAQAQLEAARAETAALRSLANGAKLLEDHPALARLRLVQALPAGSTVELKDD